MRHAQQNYRTLVLAGALLFAGAFPVTAGRIAYPAAPDPLLDGVKGACDPALAAADVTPGVDVNGNKVAAADPDAGAMAMPHQILMPLEANRKNSPVALIQNPVPPKPPACPSH
jgi:hypothetical protein